MANKFFHTRWSSPAPVPSEILALLGLAPALPDNVLVLNGKPLTLNGKYLVLGS
jgi:hypothetical protein